MLRQDGASDNGSDLNFSARPKLTRANVTRQATLPTLSFTHYLTAVLADLSTTATPTHHVAHLRWPALDAHITSSRFLDDADTHDFAPMTASRPSTRDAPRLPFLLLIRILLCAASLPLTAAVFLPFDNCLSDAVKNSANPKRLQFTPYFLDAVLGPNDVLNITFYGNVSGQSVLGNLPPANDTAYWSSPNATDSNGKITNIGTTQNYTTLTAQYTVLSFNAYNNNPGEPFCGTLVDGSECPLVPNFNTTPQTAQPSNLSAFSLSHQFDNSYAFRTLVSSVHVISGDTNVGEIACISASLTPDIGSNIAGLLTWLPAAILILKGLATLSAAIWSPWGSTDIFRWSSNYGRDEDLLRLVTPGFGDCLQYIQFVVLTGALTLQYPGFFQPAVSQASWSVLLFNESFVTHGPGTPSLADGLYNTNGTFGMTRMSQLIGMTDSDDIWACMAIWLLVIAVGITLLCQIGFFGRWLYRQLTATSEEDLRQKNLPFTLGNMIRLLFNFFILPIVALSFFQIVISSTAPAAVLACAVVLLVIMIVAAGWILRVIFTTKPRTLLFDDMPTVLLYGPLYNTYNDSAAPFALIPVFITFMRGVALGALQPSGIAQIILLAICEVILILTLNGFRPFQGQTSMNLYHTCSATVRLVTIMLMIAFVPSLAVTEATRGWIGYVILILHACVLVFGFFLNSVQTLVEVLARAAGAGGGSHAIRGSIINWRMLKKRRNRPDATTADRASTLSSAAILRDGATPGAATTPSESRPSNGRGRSLSASSQQLLGRTSGFDNFSTGGYSTYADPLASPDPEGENAATFGTMLSGTGDHYYRAPRTRKATLDTMTGPGNRTRANTRGSVSGTIAGDVPYQDAPGHGPHGSPAPAYFREWTDPAGTTNTNSIATLPGATRTDYAVREVDQYYRGPALNDGHNGPTRKLKTGPADPEGPAVAAQSWFQKLLFGVSGGVGGRGRKQRDQGKGFEVVRSARMAPAEMQNAFSNPRAAALAGGSAAVGAVTLAHAAGDEVEMQETPGVRGAAEPYSDSLPQTRSTLVGGDDVSEAGDNLETGSRKGSVSPLGSEDGDHVGFSRQDFAAVSEAAPQRNPSQSQPFDFGFNNPSTAVTPGHRGSEPQQQAGGYLRPDSETVMPMAVPASLPRRLTADTDMSDYDQPSRASSQFPDDERRVHSSAQNGLSPRDVNLSETYSAIIPSTAMLEDTAATPPIHPANSAPQDLLSGSHVPLQTPPMNPNRLSAAPSLAPSSAVSTSDIGRSGAAQDWLRAVDALTWDHPDHQSVSRASASNVPEIPPVPRIPAVPPRDARRSHAHSRTLSQELDPGVVAALRSANSDSAEQAGAGATSTFRHPMEPYHPHDGSFI